MSEKLHCIFCGTLLKYLYADARNKHYRCSECVIRFMKIRSNGEWFYLENRAWEKHYGKWVDCTREITKQIKEIVVFT